MHMRNVHHQLSSGKLVIETKSLVCTFVYIRFAYMCVRAAKALARLRSSAGSSEPSLLANTISTQVSWPG